MIKDIKTNDAGLVSEFTFVNDLTGQENVVTVSVNRMMPPGDVLIYDPAKLKPMVLTKPLSITGWPKP